MYHDYGLNDIGVHEEFDSYSVYLKLVCMWIWGEWGKFCSVYLKIY